MTSGGAHRLRRAFVRIGSGAALLGASVSAVGAQTPAGNDASSGSLSGVVRDTAGAPLRDVAVALVGGSVAARSDSSGRFTLRGVPPGERTAVFRRIGYRSAEYHWVARPGVALQVAITLVESPTELEPIVVTAPGRGARRRGTASIDGTVLDSTGAPVVGADVRLLGAGLTAVTDSEGRFSFRQLEARTYIVRLRRRGLRSSNLVMQLMEGDARGVTVRMFGLPVGTRPRDVDAASGYGVSDAPYEAFDRRNRAASGRRIVGPNDLFRASGVPLDALLRQYRSPGTPLRGGGPTAGWPASGPEEDGDCVLVDGRYPVYRPLGTFSSRDVQLVEVLRPTDADVTLDPALDALAECRATLGRHPPYFVVWTRGMR